MPAKQQSDEVKGTIELVIAPKSLQQKVSMLAAQLIGQS